jgi:hypothetical protein
VQPPSMDSVVPTPLQGEFLHLVGALGAGIAAPLLYAALLVLPLVWWTDPRYIVPAVAAMLPPAISCASAGLAAVFSELLQGEHFFGSVVCALSTLLVLLSHKYQPGTY